MENFVEDVLVTRSVILSMMVLISALLPADVPMDMVATGQKHASGPKVIIQKKAAFVSRNAEQVMAK